MVLVTLTTAALAAAFLTQQPDVVKDVDPLIGSPLVTAPDPAALHARIRSESRDLDWSPRMEAAIRARTMQIPLIGKNGNALRVTCAAKLCEIAGSMKWSAPPKEYDPKLPESRAQQDLQSAPYTDDLARLGLKFETAMFTGCENCWRMELADSAEEACV